MKKAHIGWALSVAAVAALAAQVATAWACVVLTNIWAEADYGVPGGTTTVYAMHFPGDYVELAWEDGEVLAKVEKHTFGVTVAVPAVPDGIYQIYARVGVLGQAPAKAYKRTPFEVTHTGVRGSWANSAQDGRPADGYHPDVEQPTTVPVPGVTPAVPGVTPAVPGVNPAFPGPTPTPATAAAPPRVASPAPKGLAPAGSGTRGNNSVTPGAVAPAPALAAAQPAGTPAADIPSATAPPVGPAPIAPSVDPADLWSGLRDGGTGSLTGPADRPRDPNGPGDGPGTILLTAGFVGLAGLAVAALGRRRLAHSRSARR